jgi:dTDP-4-amino-4,6-dideoxygalactose transaminase
MHELVPFSVRLPATSEVNTTHGDHLLTLQINQAICILSRDEFINAMPDKNIGVGVHYLSIPEHEYYKNRFGWKPEDYPHAMEVGRSTVSIPISVKLSDSDVSDVIAYVRSVLG